MSPDPSRRHQGLSSFLHIKIGMHLQGSSSQVFAAPFDVRLRRGFKVDDDVETVVQPDISLFCDEKKLDDRGGNGAPDLVVEILSPKVAWASRKLVSDQPVTSYKDQTVKLDLYERYKVKKLLALGFNI